MFDFKHYIPIMRWKAAEKDALLHLRPEEKKSITPLIELLMPQPKPPKAGASVKTPDELLQESIDEFKSSLPHLADQILEYWGQSPVFIDVHMIDGSIRAESLLEILTLGEKLDLFMIPVVNIIPVIDFDSDIKTREVAIDFVKKYKKGVCLRLSRVDLNKESLGSSIERFLEKTGLETKDIDLLVDFKIIDETDLSFVETIDSIPKLLEWRTFTLAGGAFPPDLSKFVLGENYTNRLDWNCWLNHIGSRELKRKPSFGDYTILHPIYKDPIRGAIPSASIRYSLKDRWLIMRGQGGQARKTAQYLANAQLLGQHAEFSGESFSFGDAYIVEKGKDLSNVKTGSPRTWLTAGINHHLTLVVSQISSLS